MSEFFPRCLSSVSQKPTKCLTGCHPRLNQRRITTLTSLGRYLPGAAQVKNKIKRVDRLLGNESLHCDIPLIFKDIINMLT